MKEEYFTQAEAQAKLRRPVVTIAEIEEVPIGTGGYVIRAEPMLTRGGYCVVVQWNMLRKREFGPRLHPYEDYFTKTTYQELLTEVTP